MRPPLLIETSAGLYCPQGQFHIDPRVPVDMAIVSHAHADHFCRGCRQYVCADRSKRLLALRLPPMAAITGVPWGEVRTLRGVKVSLHPAGHILGSAQVRLEFEGEVWVYTGDFKTTPDPSCDAFELVRCHTLITESTFARPEYRWPPAAGVFDEIELWRKGNREKGHCSAISCYVLGKAQRILAGLSTDAGLIFAHPDIHRINECYRAEGIPLPATAPWKSGPTRSNWGQSLLLVPPNKQNATGFPSYGEIATAFASGWMQEPEQIRKRRVQTGFVLSDHADYREIVTTLRDSGASRVLVTHGYIEDFVADVQKMGLEAGEIPRGFASDLLEGAH